LAASHHHSSAKHCDALFGCVICDSTLVIVSTQWLQCKRSWPEARRRRSIQASCHSFSCHIHAHPPCSSTSRTYHIGT
jgi:hypothetical protein